jgi:4Fe-4S binding domain.
MLKKIRLIIAAVFFVLLTLLFLDFTGVLHKWFGWLAKIQLLPAIVAVNVVVIVSLTLLTLIFGRIYCSIICPLGAFQDGVSAIAGKIKKRKNRFSYSPAVSWLRYGVLAIFIIAFIAGVGIIVSIFDPYAAYGRIASNLFAPLYRLVNNSLAWFVERFDSYAFYTIDVWIKGWITFGIAAITCIVVAILAWRNGRTYCNTICPVGTVLGFLSKFSIFRLTINTNKCTECKVCEHGCKASCIDIDTKSIDRSRCVTCFNCIDKCKFGAMSYALVKTKKSAETYSAESTTDSATANNDEQGGMTRRNILTLFGLMAATSAVKAQQLYVDGGLAEIEDKKIPDRKNPIAPPGALSDKNMKKHCTACQLCVSACPNNVLRPSDKLATFMQPEMSFERGYCRPECVECSLVCPTASIKPITPADKSALAIGHPVWIEENCVVNTEKLPCTACGRHCPTSAITFVAIDPNNRRSLKLPVIDKELCIGCGACEYLCPARPFSAIYIEGNRTHHSI